MMVDDDDDNDGGDGGDGDGYEEVDCGWCPRLVATSHDLTLPATCCADVTILHIYSTPFFSFSSSCFSSFTKLAIITHSLHVDTCTTSNPIALVYADIAITMSSIEAFSKNLMDVTEAQGTTPRTDAPGSLPSGNAPATATPTTMTPTMTVPPTTTSSNPAAPQSTAASRYVPTGTSVRSPPPPPPKNCPSVQTNMSPSQSPPSHGMSATTLPTGTPYSPWYGVYPGYYPFNEHSLERQRDDDYDYYEIGFWDQAKRLAREVGEGLASLEAQVWRMFGSANRN